MIQDNPPHATCAAPDVDKLSGVLHDVEAIAAELRSQSAPPASALEDIRDLSQYEDVLKALDPLADAGLVHVAPEFVPDTINHSRR